ncbi:Zyxin [Dirofilaria immitis]
MSVQQEQQSEILPEKCSKCGEGINNNRPGCTALGEMFHVTCFTCGECNKQLAGGSFYNVDGKALCEDDYMQSLEKCNNCGKPITEKLLRATGGAYHPDCFVCSVCKKCLDGVPFTVDSTNKVHCVVCFHEKFAPRCAVCSKPIIPEEGQEESVRVVAMDKSFHVNCYRCEDCNMQLSSKIEGQGCYPLDQHLYCKNCNSKRLIALSKAS